MHVKHWLIGCAICFAGIGGAAATSADGRELDSSLRGNGDVNSARESVNSSEPGSSEPTNVRDGAPRNGGNESHKGASNSTTDHAAGDITPPARSQQPHLGWQSLLPGSIQ
jgi:hypothetical protein